MGAGPPAAPRSVWVCQKGLCDQACCGPLWGYTPHKRHSQNTSQGGATTPQSVWVLQGVACGALSMPSPWRGLGQTLASLGLRVLMCRHLAHKVGVKTDLAKPGQGLHRHGSRDRSPANSGWVTYPGAPAAHADPTGLSGFDLLMSASYLALVFRNRNSGPVSGVKLGRSLLEPPRAL